MAREKKQEINIMLQDAKEKGLDLPDLKLHLER